MSVGIMHVPQGSTIRLYEGESKILNNVLISQGISPGCIDYEQDLVSIPQAYVGYINLPERKIVIDSKHPGVEFSHVQRIYTFLFASETSELDDPIYDIEYGLQSDVVRNYISELVKVVRRGLPVEYKTELGAQSHLRGKIDLVNTIYNKKQRKRDPFVCEYDDLSFDIKINQILYQALRKIKEYDSTGKATQLEKYFVGVSCTENANETALLSTNTMYCQKALTLAYLIINELSINNYGNSGYGQNLLINFDNLFEAFVKKILIAYSNDYSFSAWDNEKSYAFCKTATEDYYKSYIPDLLYDFSESRNGSVAKAILDMKNKTSQPFSSKDVYQMFFYANQLDCKKVILCYPCSEETENALLKFEKENFIIKKIHACYINIAGNSAFEFKKNINGFIEKVKKLL